MADLTAIEIALYAFIGLMFLIALTCIVQFFVNRMSSRSGKRS